MISSAFNDADMVYVTPVYAAGEAPIEGVDAAELVKIKARGHRSRRKLAALSIGKNWLIVQDKAIWSSASARATSPNGPQGWPMRSRRRADERCYACPGAWKADAMRRLHRWSGSRAGGRRNGCSSRRIDAKDLQPFCVRLDPATPVMALGLGSNMIVRDGGVPGVVVRLGKAFAKVEGRCDDAGLWRRGVGHPRFLDSARQWHCRAGIPALDPRHRRRFCPDERRRLWRRGEGHSRRLRRGAAGMANW
jgi:hypothetical protein